MPLPPFEVPTTITHMNEHGQKEVFIRHEELGRGGFSIVYRVTQQGFNKVYAMKVISKKHANSKGKTMIKELKNEMKLQKKISHPNIVRSKASFSDENNYYIVLEFCPGKSIREYLKKSEKGHLSEPETRKILKDVIRGLTFLHSNNIVHHDIKVENFIIGLKGRVKIADFGLATLLKTDDEKLFSVAGTTNYLSPEIIQKEPHSFEVDIWAVGVAAFIMLTGKPPFEAVKKEKVYERILECDYHFPSNIKLSEDAKNFVKITLQLDPRKRPTAFDLYEHPFLTKVDKEKVDLYNPFKLIQEKIQAARKYQNNFDQNVLLTSTTMNAANDGKSSYQIVERAKSSQKDDLLVKNSEKSSSSPQKNERSKSVQPYQKLADGDNNKSKSKNEQKKSHHKSDKNNADKNKKEKSSKLSQKEDSSKSAKKDEMQQKEKALKAAQKDENIRSTKFSQKVEDLKNARSSQKYELLKKMHSSNDDSTKSSLVDEMPIKSSKKSSEKLKTQRNNQKGELTRQKEESIKSSQKEELLKSKKHSQKEEAVKSIDIPKLSIKDEQSKSSKKDESAKSARSSQKVESIKVKSVDIPKLSLKDELPKSARLPQKDESSKSVKQSLQKIESSKSARSSQKTDEPKSPQKVESPRSQRDETAKSLRSSQKLDIPKLLLKDESSKSVKSSQKVELDRSSQKVESPRSPQRDETTKSLRSSQKLDIPKLLLKDESSKSVKQSQKTESSKSARSSQKVESPRSQRDESSKSARLSQKVDSPRDESARLSQKTEATKTTQKDETARSVKQAQKLEVQKLLKDESRSVKSSQKVDSSKSVRRSPQKVEEPRSPQKRNEYARSVKSSRPHHQERQHKEDALQSLYMTPLMNNDVPTTTTQNTNYYFQHFPSRNFYIGTNIPENDDIFNRPNVNTGKSGNIYYFGKIYPYY